MILCDNLLLRLQVLNQCKNIGTQIFPIFPTQSFQCSAASIYCLCISAVYHGARRDYNFDTRGSPGSVGTTLSIGAMGPPGTTQDGTRGQTCQPKSIMVVHSTPAGEKFQCESYVINVRRWFGYFNNIYFLLLKIYAVLMIHCTALLSLPGMSLQPAKKTEAFEIKNKIDDD